MALLSQCGDILIGSKRLKAIHGCICRLGPEHHCYACNVHSSEGSCLAVQVPKLLDLGVFICGGAEVTSDA